VSVFLFFGIVGVMGTHYLHTRTIDWMHSLPAAGFGLLSAGVLNVNNMRDIRNDKASGKITLAVRLGPDAAKSYHGLLIIGGLTCLMLYTALNFQGMPQWGFLVTTSVLASHLRVVLRNHDPAALDPELKRLALATFATAIAFAVGLWMV
jgi:1,4-dihydroxy-2-naphthoate octaprenyltransferase